MDEKRLNVVVTDCAREYVADQREYANGLINNLAQRHVAHINLFMRTYGERKGRNFAVVTGDKDFVLHQMFLLTNPDDNYVMLYSRYAWDRVLMERFNSQCLELNAIADVVITGGNREQIWKVVPRHRKAVQS